MNNLPTGPFEAEPTRLKVNERESYEIQIHSLPKRGKGGAHDCLRVFYSDDGEHTWREVPLTLTWRSWFSHVFAGSGGDVWPPRGEDVFKAYLRNDNLVVRYGSIFQSNREGEAPLLEATYSLAAQRWSISAAGSMEAAGS